MKPPPGRLAVATHGEELYQLVEAVQDYAIFLLSPTGEIRSWNAGATRIMGYQAAEAVGKHFSMVGSSRVDLQACKLEYSIVSPK